MPLGGQAARKHDMTVEDRAKGIGNRIFKIVTFDENASRRTAILEVAAAAADIARAYAATGAAVR